MQCDFIQLAAPSIQQLSPYQPGMPIEVLAREQGLDPQHIVKLASNENPLGCSPAVHDVIAAQVAELARYPDANGYELKQALGQKLGVEAECLTLGNGSNDVLELIAKAYLTPSSEAIISAHAFLVYKLVTQAAGAKIVETPARQWGHDLEQMLAAITAKTRLIFIANPNNPTGTWLSQAALTHFLQQVPANVVVVLDEAYFEYVDHPDYPNGIELQQQFHNLVVTRTFSKAYGLAGLRVGYGVANKEITDILNRIRQPFNTNSLALAGAVTALSDQTFLNRSVAVNRAGMTQLEAGFNRLNLDFIPSVGNFISVKVGSGAGGIYQKLLSLGVIVRPVGNYAMPEHLRISIGTEAENTVCLSALQRALEGLDGAL